MSETAAEPPGEAQEGDRFRHAEGPKRSERAHEAILTAAQEVLADVGYQKASIERIARHAGVGKQTIYRWWSSRAALFMEVYTSLAERHVKPPEGEAVEDALVALWKQLCSFWRRARRSRVSWRRPSPTRVSPPPSATSSSGSDGPCRSTFCGPVWTAARSTLRRTSSAPSTSSRAPSGTGSSWTEPPPVRTR